MECKKLYVVFECDQWLSTSSKVVKSVCDEEGLSLVLTDIMKEYGVVEDEIEDNISYLFDTFQYRGDDFGILVEEFTLNEKPYSV